MAYIEQNPEVGVVISMNIDDPHPPIFELYVDSDHGGCMRTARSTSGGHIRLATKNAAAPILSRSKLQASVAVSTAEAEYASLEHNLKKHGLPLWEAAEQIFEMNLEMKILIDNDAAQIIGRQGVSKQLKYLHKHQRVRVGFVHDVLHEDHTDRSLERVDTTKNVADLMTKNLARLEHGRITKIASMMTLAEYKSGVVNDIGTKGSFATSKGFDDPTALPVHSAGDYDALMKLERLDKLHRERAANKECPKQRNTAKKPDITGCWAVDTF